MFPNNIKFSTFEKLSMATYILATRPDQTKLKVIQTYSYYTNISQFKIA